MARDLESLQDRLPPFSQAEAEAVIAARWNALFRRRLRALARRWPPPRSRRCIAPRPNATASARRSRSRCCGPSRRAFPPRPRRFLLCRAQGRSAFGGSAPAAAGRGHRDAVALGGDGDGSAARGRGAVGDGGKHPRRSGLSRARGRLGPHHAQRADDGVGRRHRADRSARLEQRRSICAISGAR